MNNLDNMTDLERIDALKLEIQRHYYEFKHQEIRNEIQNEIQRDTIRALENQIKDLNHKLIEQEIELSALVKKVI